MSYNFLSTINKASLELDEQIRSRINSTPSLKENWKSYLYSIDAPKGIIDQLGNSNATYIVTGQQIGFLCSPILSLYKAITAEVLAQEVSKISGILCLPVFWLQSEDHDLEEISNAIILNQSRELKQISLQAPQSNRIPVGDLSIREMVKGLDLKALELSEDVLNSILLSWDKKTISESFAYLFYKIFPNSNSILFDPRVLHATKIASEIYESTIKEPTKIQAMLRTRYREMKTQGNEPPIQVDKDRSLFFYSADSIDRYRLNFDTTHFKINEIESSAEELLDELKECPEKFSSSALLRPLIQDYIFNPVAYIGGKTELNYHKQITPLYKHFKMRQPNLVERAAGVILETKVSKWWEGCLGTPDLFFKSQTELKTFFRTAVANTITVDLLKTQISKKTSELEEILTKQIITTDKTLENPLQKTIKLVRDSLGKLLSKYEESQLRSNTVNEDRISRLTDISHPNGQLQERSISAISIFNLLGEDSFSLIKSNIAEEVKQNITLIKK